MEYLGNKEQGECHSDGDMGVCEGEQKHPIRMKRWKGKSVGSRKYRIIPRQRVLAFYFVWYTDILLSM